MKELKVTILDKADSADPENKKIVVILAGRSGDNQRLAWSAHILRNGRPDNEVLAEAFSRLAAGLLSSPFSAAVPVETIPPPQKTFLEGKEVAWPC